jgi:formylglycine-generating enzyme required for sulfatase activity
VLTPIKTEQIPEEEEFAENERLREIDGAVEVLIPAGEFLFGCDPQHNGGFECLPDELPLEKQYLETFAIDKFEVTNVQYARCVAAGACEEPVYIFLLRVSLIMTTLPTQITPSRRYHGMRLMLTALGWGAGCPLRRNG